MATYLISYDLVKPGRNYEDLYEHLKSYGTYAHPLESVWLIVTSRTATEVRDAAVKYLDANDKLLVVGLTGVGAWRGLPSAMSSWLKKNL